MFGPFDGTCNQLREKADKGEKCHGIFGGLQPAPVDVDGVAQGLERVKTNPHGQDDIQVERMYPVAPMKKQIGQLLREKPKIFEEEEHAQVGR